MIKPWLFEFFHQPLDPQLRSDPLAVHAHYKWYLDLWAAADKRDFEGIFFSEHHFGGLQPVAEPLDLECGGAHDTTPPGRDRVSHSLRHTVAHRRGDGHARSPHRRSTGDRTRQRYPA